MVAATATLRVNGTELAAAREGEVREEGNLDPGMNDPLS